MRGIRRGSEAQFVDLIPQDAVCEGGEEYDQYIDLGVSIPSGARLIEFYLIREETTAPRHAELELGFSSLKDTPIRMRVQQTPAQGQARLTIEGAEPSVKMARLSVNWGRMEVLHGYTPSISLDLQTAQQQPFKFQPRGQGFASKRDR